MGKGTCGRASAWARDSGVGSARVEKKDKKKTTRCHVDPYHVTQRCVFHSVSPTECVQRPALNNTLTLPEPECFPPPRRPLSTCPLLLPLHPRPRFPLLFLDFDLDAHTLTLDFDHDLDAHALALALDEALNPRPRRSCPCPRP